MQAELEQECKECIQLDRAVDEADSSVRALLELHRQRAIRAWPFGAKIVINWAFQQAQAAQCHLAQMEQVIASIFVGVVGGVFPLPGFGLVVASILQCVFGGNALVITAVLILCSPFTSLATAGFLWAGSFLSETPPFMPEDMMLDPTGTATLLLRHAVLPWALSALLLLHVALPAARFASTMMAKRRKGRRRGEAPRPQADGQAAPARARPLEEAGEGFGPTPVRQLSRGGWLAV